MEGDEHAIFGVTWYAQDSLGEVVFYEPPEVGDRDRQGPSYAEVEVGQGRLRRHTAPLSGEIVAVNDALTDNPETINEDPYGDGWLVKVKLSRHGAGRRAHGRGRLPGPIGERLALTPPLYDQGGVSTYTSATDSDRKAMLEAIGVSSLEELFADIPADVRLDRPLDLPAGLSETEAFDHLSELAARNADADAETCFLGAGMYDHYVPAIVDAITQRSEFLTPYTPYQPEVSQGGLQAMFEFQTAISELCALPVANAALYEGPSSAASAAYLALGATKRSRLIASSGLHPHSRQALRTYARGFGAEVIEVGLEGGLTDPAELASALDDDTAAVFVQNPNFLGGVEDLEALADAAHQAGALAIAAVDPITLGVLRAPGSAASTSPSARASRSGAASTSAVPRSGSSAPPRSTCGGCRGGSRARPPTPTGAGDSSSPCRHASSTSAARRPPTTSAPRRP